MPVDRDCETCEFFDADAENALPSPYVGRCRRRPPNGNLDATKWPGVAPGDWCGEYKKKTDGRVHSVPIR